MVNEVEIIENVGAGETAKKIIEISSTGFYVKFDNEHPTELYSPAITKDIEIENDGELSRTQDQCGNTEKHRSANNGWSIRVKGIVTANEDREGNLSLQLLRDTIATSETIQIRGDVIGKDFRRVEVSNTVISQSTDLVSVQTKSTDGKEKAFEFQLQLGQSEDDS